MLSIAGLHHGAISTFASMLLILLHARCVVSAKDKMLNRWRLSGSSLTLHPVKTSHSTVTPTTAWWRGDLGASWEIQYSVEALMFPLPSVRKRLQLLLLLGRPWSGWTGTGTSVSSTDS